MGVSCQTGSLRCSARPAPYIEKGGEGIGEEQAGEAEEKGHGSDRCLFTAGEEGRGETGGVVSDQRHADLDLEGERPKKKVSACGETETAQTHRNRKAKVRPRKNKSQQPVSHANTARRNSSPVLFLVFFTARYLCLGAATSTLGPHLDFIGRKNSPAPCKTYVYSAANEP